MIPIAPFLLGAVAAAASAVHLGVSAFTFITLNRKVDSIMATQAQLVVTVNELTATVVKVGGETRTLLTRIQELLDIIANAPNLPVIPELDAAVLAAQEQINIVDALVADAPAPAPTPAP